MSMIRSATGLNSSNPMTRAEGLAAWTGLRLIERIEEGNRNEVWRGEIDGMAIAVRRSRRADDSLDWELDLIEALAREGFTVPTVVTTDDGQRSADGRIVQRWIEGHPPTTSDHWHAVASTLQRLHQTETGLGQRPGCKPVTELTRTDHSVDADLAAIPVEFVDELLDVFASVSDAPQSIIHGDVGPSNLRICPDGTVGLLDFDESRVDVCWHDLSELGVQVLDDESHRRALRLSNAWEAANAWVVEPEYAQERLAALRATG